MKKIITILTITLGLASVGFAAEDAATKPAAAAAKTPAKSKHHHTHKHKHKHKHKKQHSA